MPTSSAKKPNKSLVLAYDYASNHSSRQKRFEVDERITKGKSNPYPGTDMGLPLPSTESTAKLYTKNIKLARRKVRVKGQELVSNPNADEKFRIPPDMVVASVFIPWDIWMRRFIGQYGELCVVYPDSLLYSDHHLRRRTT
jgi:hypothetical protein